MSSLRDKMLNYESVPPGETWDKIAAALDEAQHGDQFPGRLHAMEITPPTFAWNKIAAELDGEVKQEAVVVNQPSRFRYFLRYAAAAVVIGAVAFGILRWTGSSYQSTTGTAVAGITPDSGRTNSAALIPTDSQRAAGTAPDEDAANPGQDRKLLAKLDRPVRSQSRRLNSAVQTVGYPAANKISSAIYTYNDHVPTVADRYIMLMTPDGNLIRMSKKWGNLVCCVSGEDPDAGCKDQLKKWQQKMATSSLTTSAGNFMDIINLVNSLDEGTDL
jgi:hypothetical protein